MNYSGSYRRLLDNAKAAIIAAIEVYNKPTFTYRDECSVILLLNAWELLLKAVLSKNRASIYYPKKRNQSYKTYSWQDSLLKARPYLPGAIDSLPIRRNLELLGTYRDNAVHFYNAAGFEVLVYALLQTSIINFRDVLEKTFGQKLEEEVNWKLLPLGIEPPLDPLTYISSKAEPAKSSAVKQFLAELADATKEVTLAGSDTGRLLTIFNVKLESVKKVESADLVAGVGDPAGKDGPLFVTRTQDPNITHPLRQREIVDAIESLHDRPFTQYTFQAIVWKHDLKSSRQYCWEAREGTLTKYSNDVLTFIKRLSSADVGAALTDYREHLRARRPRRAS